VSVAVSSNIENGEWETIDLTAMSVGAWEPTLDLQLWKEKQELNLFVQRVAQKDNEQSDVIGPQMVYVLEWVPFGN
jgi:hypothetical protein